MVYVCVCVCSTCDSLHPPTHPPIHPLIFTQDVVSLRSQATDTLLRLHALLAPLSPDYMPELLHSFMRLFCNLVRMELLAVATPAPLVTQLYVWAHAYVTTPGSQVLGEGAVYDGLHTCTHLYTYTCMYIHTSVYTHIHIYTHTSMHTLTHMCAPHRPLPNTQALHAPLPAPVWPPSHAALISHLQALRAPQGPVGVLQRALFQLGPRIAQVLTTVVLPTLRFLGDAAGAHGSGVLDVGGVEGKGRGGGGGGSVQGMTRARLIGNLQWVEDVRIWGMYGLLVFPGMVCGVGGVVGGGIVWRGLYGGVCVGLCRIL